MLGNFDIVTVNYNSSSSTSDMLESIFPQNQYIGRIVVVDNNSDQSELKELERSVLKFQEKGLDVLLLKLSDNLGYFNGLNRGIACLQSLGDKSVIVCNNDLVFCDDFFQKLDSKTISNDVYAICPSVKTIDGYYQNPSLENKPSKLRFLMYRLYYANYFLGTLMIKVWRALGKGANSRIEKDEVEREIFIGIGAIYILTPPFFKLNKKLSAPTFLYGEEAFLSKQICETKGVQLYCPDIEVLHMESVSTKKIPSKEKYNLTRRSFELYKDYFS